MKILALEFSSQQRSVAVADGTRVLSDITIDQLQTGPLVLIEQALQQAQVGREEIQRFALGIGPGSYTGNTLGHRRSSRLATGPRHRALRGR